MTAKGYLSNGLKIVQGASWSEEFDEKELRGTLGGEHDLELRGCMCRFLEHRRRTFQQHLLQCGMLVLGVVFG